LFPSINGSFSDERQILVDANGRFLFPMAYRP